MKKIPRSLSFSSVLIKPKRSSIKSRYGGQIDTSTKISKKAPKILRPIISSNMDTVTEHKMAIEMALNGCIGVIHRNMSPQNQANQVRLVKEKMRVFEENPPTVTEKATIKDVLNLLKIRERGYVIIHKGNSYNGKFVGIATTRDFIAAPPKTPIKQVMTPNLKGRLFTLQQGTTLEKAVKFMKKNRIEKVPIVDKNGNLKGVYTLMDYWFKEKFPQASLDRFGRLMVGAAIGVKDLDVERAHKLIKTGTDILILDIAHGHLKYTKNMLKRLKGKENIKTPIIAGNFATAKGVKYARYNGADAVKVGIGPGFVCDTRSIAGVGVEQISAISEAAEALSSDPIPIIADGGIREPGDVGKALVAGANSVMIGSLLAGTDKSPGTSVVVDGILMKNVRGMASASAFEERLKLGDTTSDSEKYVPEGRNVFTPYKGDTTDVLKQLVGGLLSTMSYVGAHTIEELHEKGEFTRRAPDGDKDEKRPLS